MKTPNALSASTIAAMLFCFAPGMMSQESKSKHEGPTPAGGEIVSVSKEAISIKDHKGHEHAFFIHAETRYGTKRDPQTFQQLEKGDHVLISYKKEGDNDVAEVIRELPPHQQQDEENVKSHHEGPPPAAGEILSITKEGIEIRDHQNHEQKFVINAETKYGTKIEPQTFGQLEKGDHLLVTYAKDGAQKVAEVIRELPAHGHGKEAKK